MWKSNSSENICTIWPTLIWRIGPFPINLEVEMIREPKRPMKDGGKDQISEPYKGVNPDNTSANGNR